MADSDLRFGTLAPWGNLWYASIRKRLPDNGVKVVDGVLLKTKEAASEWLIDRLEGRAP